MATDPVLRMLGLARRAGKLAYGDELVREAGVEPARPCEHWHLKPASLPIPPLAQVVLRRSAQEIYYHRMSPVSTLFSLFFCVREKKLS